MVAERRLTLARPFEAGTVDDSVRVASRRLKLESFFNRRYATGTIPNLILALKGRAKVSRRSAAKANCISSYGRSPVHFLIVPQSSNRIDACGACGWVKCSED